MRDLPAEFSPWGDPAWRDEARSWIRGRLREAGRRPTGELTPRLRAWSVTGQVPTDAGPVWFKANPPGSAFEPALTVALSRWAPGLVLTPLAADAGRGWSLQPDGGPMLGEMIGDDACAGEETLRRYATLQRTVAGHRAELAALGLPDLRPAKLPGLFAALRDSPQVREQVGHPDGISPAQYAALGELGPQLNDWCERLAASRVPPSLEHSDLHGWSMFWNDGQCVFFDWGDASLAHPFTSLLVFLRVVAADRGLGPGAPELLRLRDAYLDEWADYGGQDELRAEAALAVRLAPVSRAASWRRVFPSAAGHVHAEHGRLIGNWLAYLLEPDLRL